MAYGTASGVAAYCGAYTLNGQFTNETVPKLTSVENWLTQASALLDNALENQGFAVPLTETKAVNEATMLIEQIVSDIAKGANNTGRFFSERALKSGVSFWRVITNDLDGWAEQYAFGMAQRTARGETNEFGIGFRDTDNSGDSTHPIFQRKAFGEQFQDWDDD